jgi:hypothetical protein
VPDREPAAVAHPTAAGSHGNSAGTPAVVLAMDEPLSRHGVAKSTVRRPAVRRARDQRNLAVGMLVVLIAVLLPILIYVLLHQ